MYPRQLRFPHPEDALGEEDEHKAHEPAADKLGHGRPGPCNMKNRASSTIIGMGFGGQMTGDIGFGGQVRGQIRKVNRTPLILHRATHLRCHSRRIC